MMTKVLLIDDDLRFCAETQEYLTAKSFYVVTEADGDKALIRLHQMEPDVVILDIALQKEHINGLNICTEIRQHPKYEKGTLGIIMISGHHSKYRNWTRSLQQGADRYLIKPFELDVLVEEIKALQSLIAGPQVLALDDVLTIYFDQRRVTVNGQSVSLTKREFDVLAYLAKPPNTTRTRFELLDAVWKTQDYTDGAVAKCIHMLRQKISPDRPSVYVESVRGVGYKLNKVGSEE